MHCRRVALHISDGLDAARAFGQQAKVPASVQICARQVALLLQVEGGFVFGLGMMLQEHVDYSPEGQPLYDSTWDYKIPTAACIPRQFNIALLKVRMSVDCWRWISWTTLCCFLH